MDNKIKKIGNYSPSGHNASSIVDTNGISPTVMENHGTVTAIMEANTATTICLNSKVDGKQPSLEHRIYYCGGISTAITTGFLPSIAEPRVEQVGNIVDDTDRNFKNPQAGRVYSAQGLAPTINTCQGGNREPKILQKFGDRGTNQYSVRDIAHTIPSNPMSDREQMLLEPQFRIRKLTPRECFRLMDVDEADIDKIQAAGISNSQQYKLAGNSIVVSCLYHLFRKLFVETENENQQLELF